MIPLLASLSYRWFQYTSWLIRKFAFIEVKKMHESLCFCFLCRQLWSMYCWLMIIASISSLRTRVYSSPPCPKHVLCVPAARQFCKRLCRSEARSVRALSVCARLSWDEGCITHSWAVACWRVQWVQGVELMLSSSLCIWNLTPPYPFLCLWCRNQNGRSFTAWLKAHE